MEILMEEIRPVADKKPEILRCTSRVVVRESIQNLIQDFKIVVFEKGELDFREKSELKIVLPLLAYQNSNWDVQIIIQDIVKRTVRLKYIDYEIETLMAINWIR